MGFARCGACGGFYTMEQYVAWRCEGTPVEGAFTPRVPGGVRCALCGEAVHVDPRYRAHVQCFGATCDACFGLVEAIGSAT